MRDDRSFQMLGDPADGLPTFECILCFECFPSDSDRSGCSNCTKEWCRGCDLRWRIEQTCSALLPSCPFCRQPLPPLIVEETTRSRYYTRDRLEGDFIDRFITVFIHLMSYLILALVLCMLPIIESFLSSSDEIFFAYFCLVLFVLIFLCCHLVHHRRCQCVDEEEEEEEDADE